MICDFETHHPEVVPLRNTDAEHIAEELMKVFSRVGVPREIATDQGVNHVKTRRCEGLGTSQCINHGQP